MCPNPTTPNEISVIIPKIGCEDNPFPWQRTENTRRIQQDFPRETRSFDPVKELPGHPRILLFDGVCNLCNGIVHFVIRHDPDGKVSFASLQSDYGQETLKHLGLSTDELHSFIYFRDGQHHQRSTGFLYLARDLGGWWRLWEASWIFPRFIRDFVYGLVAKSRYSIFGKREQCYVPTPELTQRFVAGSLST
jgi:predicted DCC family thiol-disulfide oxidoreductase YuxK